MEAALYGNSITRKSDHPWNCNFTPSDLKTLNRQIGNVGVLARVGEDTPLNGNR